MPCKKEYPDLNIPNSESKKFTNKRPRICFVTFNPAISGQFMSILSLALEMETCGYQSYILSPLFSGRVRHLKEIKDSLPSKRFIYASFFPLFKLMKQWKRWTSSWSLSGFFSNVIPGTTQVALRSQIVDAVKYAVKYVE